MKTSDSAILSNTGSGEEEVVGLAWLLDRPELGLIAHHLTELDPSLEWAHAIELPDPTPWLRGHGLVLTTGLHLSRGAIGQEAYVARLAAAGARALGIGTGLRFANVPRGLAPACARHGLSLIEVPLPTPFLAVVRAISERLGALRRLRLQEALDAQQQLTRVALRGGSAAVVRSLARHLACGVVLLDGRQQVTARSGRGAPPIERITQEIAGRPGRAIRVAGAGHELEIQPLGERPTAPTGWLALGRDRGFTGTERLVLNHALSVLRFQWANEVGSPPVSGQGAAAESAVLRHLLAERAGAADLAAGVDLPNEPLHVIALRDHDAGATRMALDRGRSAGHTLGGWLPHQSVSEPVAVLLTAALDEAVAAVRRGSAPGVRIGISHAASLATLSGARAAAVRALDLSEPDQIVHAGDLPLDRLLAQEQFRGLLDGSANAWLRALEAHDVTHDAQLVTSVRTYLAHHGAWDPAARALGVHRHTLRHRVTRAEVLGGFDLEDPTHRALLVLALAAK